MITVHYRDVGPLVVGESARVWPIDHPGPYVSNTCWVSTTKVLGTDLRSNPRGPIFWTAAGKRYVPGDTDESMPKA